MRGFLSLEPDDATLALLAQAQNRLRDALTRQGVYFPDRLGATLLAWPFATEDELDEAAETIGAASGPTLTLGALEALPNSDRPHEIGFALRGAESMQSSLFGALRTILDPDPTRPIFVRLARVSPPSRKVGAALRGSGLLGAATGVYVPRSFSLWRQTPSGFAIHRSLTFGA